MDDRIIKQVSDCPPEVIDHFVGQRRVVEQCKIALDASWNEGTKLPHMLMMGSSGLGKTELCHVLAKERACELHEQLGQNIQDPQDLHGLLLTPKDLDILCLDEVHQMNSICQTTLYRAMENQQIFLESKRGQKCRPIRIANFTILAATTDPQYLLQPLRDRFRIILDFEFYSRQELEQLLHDRVRRLGWQIEESVITLISQRGKGTPRIALRLLESINMMASSENSDRISANHFHKYCAIENLDPLGLTCNEVKYLKILYENDGVTRLNIIASRLGLNLKHVSSIIEQYLIREGIVTKNNCIRVLTQKGLEHLRQYHSQEI